MLKVNLEILHKKCCTLKKIFIIPVLTNEICTAYYLPKVPWARCALQTICTDVHVQKQQITYFVAERKKKGKKRREKNHLIYNIIYLKRREKNHLIYNIIYLFRQRQWTTTICKWEVCCNSCNNPVLYLQIFVLRWPWAAQKSKNWLITSVLVQLQVWGNDCTL